MVRADCLPTDPPSLAEQLERSSVVVRIRGAPTSGSSESHFFQTETCFWEAYNETAGMPTLQNLVPYYEVIQTFKQGEQEEGGVTARTTESRIPILYDTDTGIRLQPPAFVAGDSSSETTIVVFATKVNQCQDTNRDFIDFPTDDTPVYAANECWRHPKWEDLSAADQNMLLTAGMKDNNDGSTSAPTPPIDPKTDCTIAPTDTDMDGTIAPTGSPSQGASTWKRLCWNLAVLIVLIQCLF